MPEFDASLLVHGLTVGLVAGGVGGLLAGLAGIGGGLVYVPVFYALMPGDQETLSPQIMTSMVAVFITGLFSTRAHWRLGHVRMPVFRQLIPGLVLGAAIGLWSTLHIPESVALLVLAALNGWVAWDYGRKVTHTGVAALPTWSGPIGYISGMLGIGGGTMLVPLLRRMLPLREAVGTTALCGTTMALAAVLLNTSFEHQWVGIMAGRSWFMIGTWLGIAMAIPAATRLAARLHAGYPEHVLRPVLRLLFAGLSILLFLAAAVAWVRG